MMAFPADSPAKRGILPDCGHGAGGRPVRPGPRRAYRPRTKVANPAPPACNEVSTGSATVSAMASPPLFADDNSSYRRAMRKQQREERVREERRRQILATLRRLKEEAADEEVLAARERARRHADLLERYPPLW